MGPSTDPKVNRLDMTVEDHPFAFRNLKASFPRANTEAALVIFYQLPLTIRTSVRAGS